MRNINKDSSCKLPILANISIQISTIQVNHSSPLVNVSPNMFDV